MQEWPNLASLSDRSLHLLWWDCVSENKNGTCQYFCKMTYFQYHSISIDPWTYVRTVRTTFRSMLLQFISVLQIVWNGHVILACAVSITTAVSWLCGLNLIALVNYKPPATSLSFIALHTRVQLCICVGLMQNLRLPRIKMLEIFYFHQLWIHVFGIA